MNENNNNNYNNDYNNKYHNKYHNKDDVIDRKRPVGIFDSGVGGLTVLREIEKLLPNENFIYFGDTKRFPFGTKSLEDVKSFSFQITNFLISKNIKLLVVACNTASAAALADLKKFFNIPIVGVIEPGARAAVSLTKVKRIGVIATNSTIASKAYEIAIKKIESSVDVYSEPASELVDYIEKGKFNGTGNLNFDENKLRNLILKFIFPLISKNIDVLILGCTHFPLIEEEINNCCNFSFLKLEKSLAINLVNSAYETAKQVRLILQNNSLLNNSLDKPKKVFFETGSNCKFLEIGKFFLGYEIEKVEKVNLDTIGGANNY